ncbi:hypothetical protein Y032_0055g2610 [Ancylostoma ceylanicum]|uniref:Uncharacterized protein n=1 Tax=Ancylostoma ceylanicum TaxID=53326 RepID=A0A016U6V2_9BILA|nr:hypothetical protein Y032_0055g2610 [Ancylostoma ceylanicum]
MPSSCMQMTVHDHPSPSAPVTVDMRGEQRSAANECVCSNWILNPGPEKVEYGDQFIYQFRSQSEKFEY